MPPTLPGFIRCGNPTEIAYIAAPVGLGVGIYDFSVIAGPRNADVILVTHYRRGIYSENNDLALARLSHPDDDAVFGVVKINPFESFVGVVQVPQAPARSYIGSSNAAPGVVARRAVAIATVPSPATRRGSIPATGRIRRP